MLQVIIIIIFVFLVGGVIGYFAWGKKQTSVPGQTSSRKITYVTLSIAAPFSNAVLTIKEDGSIAYWAQEPNQARIKDSGTLTLPQIKELNDLIEQNNFFEMKSNNDNPTGMTDGSTYAIAVSYVLSGQLDGSAVPITYLVSCYEPDCEFGFSQIRDKILSLWGKDVLNVGV
ncbi:MAG: hypothetical protein ABSC29_01775 [Minisyncoccia bacterium]